MQTEQHAGRLRKALETYVGVRHPANVAAEAARAEDSRAEQIARKVTDFMATARFLVYQSAIIVVWVGYNVAVASGGLAFDRYPFILLNLAFSTQAAFAAPLILLSGRKAEARARVQADLDFDHNARSLAILRAIAGKLNVDVSALPAGDLDDAPPP